MKNPKNKNTHQAYVSDGTKQVIVEHSILLTLKIHEISQDEIAVSLGSFWPTIRIKNSYPNQREHSQSL